jgi:hypothetical protein
MNEQLRPATVAVCACFAASSIAAAAQQGTDRADDLIRAVRNARASTGFEIRLKVSGVRPDGQPSAIVKVVVVGDVTSVASRLVARRLDGEEGAAFSMAAIADQNGNVRSVQAAAPDEKVVASDPYESQPADGLYIWDMLAPWWSWPLQVVDGRSKVGRQPCTLVTSRNESKSALVRSVTSCVDVGNGLALSIELRGTHGALIRRIEVVGTVRNEAHRLVPRQLRITLSGEETTRVEVYAGDEHHETGPATFHMLDTEMLPPRSRAVP